MGLLRIIGRGQLATAVIEFMKTEFRELSEATFCVPELDQDVNIIASFRKGFGNRENSENISQMLKNEYKSSINIIFSTLSFSPIADNYIYIPITKSSPFTNGFLNKNNFYCSKIDDGSRILNSIFREQSFTEMDIESLIVAKNATNVILNFHYAAISLIKCKVDDCGLEFLDVKKFLENDDRLNSMPLDWGIWPGGYCLDNSMKDVFFDNPNIRSFFESSRNLCLDHYLNRIMTKISAREQNVIFLGGGYKKGSVDDFASSRVALSRLLKDRIDGSVSVFLKFEDLEASNFESFHGLVVNTDLDIFPTKMVMEIFSENVRYIVIDSK